MQLVHRNLMACARALHAMIPIPEGGRVISWLPSAHIAERAAHHYLPIVFGLTITTCPNPRELARLPAGGAAALVLRGAADLGEDEGRARGAPRGAARRAARAHRAGAGGVAREGAARAGRRARCPPSWPSAWRRPMPRVFAMLRSMLGLDEAVSVNVGAAPTPRDVLEFFHALGIRVAELWGMSETTGAGTVNPLDRIKLGTVGHAGAGRRDPARRRRRGADPRRRRDGRATATCRKRRPRCSTADGWLATGDVGEIDADGYLRIVDRKKELIISSAGKNMSPANIESTLKGVSPLIGQACVIGDRRPYNTALRGARSGLRAGLGGAAGRRGRDARRAGARAARARTRVQEAVDTANAPAVARRADQAVPSRARRLGAGRRRADARR